VSQDPADARDYAHMRHTPPRVTLWCRIGLHRWVPVNAATLLLGPPYAQRCAWCGKRDLT
jgi:hypothetical protein